MEHDRPARAERNEWQERHERRQRDQRDNGANGAVAGYVAGGVDAVTLGSTQKTIGEKVLPAGSYLVAGKAEVVTEANGEGLIGVKCELLDAGKVLNTSNSDTPLGLLGGRSTSRLSHCRCSRS